jgi:hypothetical protein
MCELALALLVLRVFRTDYEKLSAAADDFAVFAHWLDAGAYLHKNLLIGVAAHSARNSASREVVRRDFHGYAVAGQHADLVHPQPACNVRQDDLT